MYVCMCIILAYLRDSLTFMGQVAINTVDYLDAATTSVLPPDILPVEDLRNILKHIESELPSVIHLPITLNGMTPFISTSIPAHMY